MIKVTKRLRQWYVVHCLIFQKVLISSIHVQKQPFDNQWLACLLEESLTASTKLLKRLEYLFNKDLVEEYQTPHFKKFT